MIKLTCIRCGKKKDENLFAAQQRNLTGIVICWDCEKLEATKYPKEVILFYELHEFVKKHKPKILEFSPSQAEDYRNKLIWEPLNNYRLTFEEIPIIIN